MHACIRELFFRVRFMNGENEMIEGGVRVLYPSKRYSQKINEHTLHMQGLEEA